jgi:hypothetical protein
MRKDRHHAMIRSATSTTTSPPPAAARKRPAILPTALIVLLVIAVIVTGVGVLETTGGASNYACLSVSHQDSTVKVTTTGLLHYLDSAYYISCNEGSNLPTSTFKSLCLTITPQTIPATIGVGASTEYYHLATGGDPITLVGAPAPTNGTEIITPSSVSLSISC